MARTRRWGLDYFPLDTDFIQNPLMRRIMKQEGDESVTILLAILSRIYSGEGYFVRVDGEFYEDVADCFFQADADKVERVVKLAVKYGIFHNRMLEEQRILTSAKIQEQFLLITKRKKSLEIQPEYSLVAEEANVAEKSENVAIIPENVTIKGENATFPRASNKTKLNQTKENLLLKGSSKTGGTAIPPLSPRGGEDDGKPSEVDISGSSSKAEAPPLGEAGRGLRVAAPSKYTQEYIDSLVPPNDGLRRNLDGLRLNMKMYRVPPQEQYAIVMKTNFGVIGHPLWRGFETLRTSHGKIVHPGRYLLSLCR